MADKQNISLLLDVHRVSLAVERDKEPVYREAAKRVNEVYAKYSKAFPNLPVEQLWVYTALELAVNFQSDVRDKNLQPVLEKVREITTFIDNTLNIDNNT